MFEFIKTLSESKVFRSESDFKSYSNDDLQLMLYMYILGLCALSQEKDTEKSAREYISKTIAYGGFNVFRGVTNDLYMLCYSQRDNKYFDQKKFIMFMQMLQFGMHMGIYSYLNGYQRDLSIKNANIKSISRIFAYWNSSSETDKSYAIKMLHREIYMRTTLSEIFPLLKELE